MYTVTEKIKMHASEMPDKAAFIIKDQIISYAELYKKINMAACYFTKMGIGKGKHVVSVATPDLNYVVCMYALLGLGAVHIPAEKKIPAARLCSIADSVDADLIISPEDPGHGIPWISGGEECGEGAFDPEWNPVPVSDDCAEIIFTTGTTGKSKGVMLTSHCLDAYIEAMQPSFKLTEKSVFILTTPLNHVGGLHRMHQCMSAGSTVILMDGIINIKGFFENADKYGVTHTYLPPASVKVLLTLARTELAKLDGKLQFIYTASAPFPTKDMETLVEILPNTRLYQGYGSSEMGGICNCCYNAPGETINCLGKPHPCTDVKLLDDEGRVINEPHVEGKLICKSAMNMLGYYNEPELTASVLIDGYVHTSDLMYYDEKGKLYFAGRGDDVINVKGFKIAPTEVENIALKYPSVSDCVCIPYNDKKQGCVVKMMICVEENAHCDLTDFTKYLAANLEPYKVPKTIETVPALERTANGKLDRKKMIKLYSNI